MLIIIQAVMLLQEERNNLARVSRKKCRPPKCAFDFDYGPPERVADSQQQRRRHHQFCRLLDSSFKFVYYCEYCFVVVRAFRCVI